MDNKYVVIIILVVALVAVVAGCLYFVSIPATDNNHVNETNITNNGTYEDHKTKTLKIHSPLYDYIAQKKLLLYA